MGGIVNDADIADALYRLELFNEQATFIEESKTYQMLEAGEAGVRFVDPETGDPCIEWYGPDKESRLILVSLRGFMHDADGYSLRKMAGLYEWLPVGSALRDRFMEARKHINDVLTREIINDTLKGRVWTFGSLIDTYMYGEVIHPTPHKRALVKEMEEPNQFMDWYFFWRGFQSVVDAILYIRLVNRVAMKELNGAYPMVEGALR